MSRYEGVRFSDGSVAVRRISADPCERQTHTFESVRECNEELGREDLITWIADDVQRHAPPRIVGRGVEALFPVHAVPYAKTKSGADVYRLARPPFGKAPTLVRTEGTFTPDGPSAALCNCCGKPSNPERTSMPRCDWYMAHCRIATGVHTGYEPTKETEEQ